MTKHPHLSSRVSAHFAYKFPSNNNPKCAAGLLSFSHFQLTSLCRVPQNVMIKIKYRIAVKDEGF